MGRAGCLTCNETTLDFEFTMAFQPVVDMQARRIDAYEALVRGPAGESAESVLSKVTPENRYAFDQTCRTKAISLAARLGIDRQLNINFLPNAMYQAASCLKQTLLVAARHKFPLKRLTFEVIEDETPAAIEHLQQVFAAYRHRGFKVALDDFGAGYSGLERLAELRPDIIKIDRGLVHDCDHNDVRLTIIAGMIKIARELGTEIVLEGVETQAEALALQSVGGRYMQGYFFARPLLEAAASDAMINWPEPVPGVAAA